MEVFYCGEFLPRFALGDVTCVKYSNRIRLLSLLLMGLLDSRDHEL